MQRDLDVLIVGAGPGGVAAASTARGLGLNVVVVDKNSFPRDKTCGDGLTTNALRILEGLGVDVPNVTGFQPVREVVLVSPSGRRVELPMPADGEHSVVVPRVELDAALVAHARSVGVEIRDGIAVTAIRERHSAPVEAAARVEQDGVVATLSDGSELDARFVIAADGHWSTVRRLQEPDRARDLGTWHAARQYFHSVADPRQWVLFPEVLLPGYAWVFPLPDGRANVGFCMQREHETGKHDADGRGRLKGKQAAAMWRVVLDHPWTREVLGPDAEPEGHTSAWPIPAAFDPDCMTNGRVLYVGDAAGVVDPMTGEGIAQALESGVLAARAVASGGGHRAVTARYTRDVQRALGRDLGFARALQRVMRVPTGARAAIAAAGLTTWTRRSFARWMFEDYPRASVLTPDRWKRGLFTSPGAFASEYPVIAGTSVGGSKLSSSAKGESP